jgi:O-antigen ligase
VWTVLVLVVASPLLLAAYYYGVVEKETVAEKISRTGRAEDALTLTGRVYIWEYIANKSADAPIKGHGYATTRDFMPREWSTQYGWTTTSAHNTILQSLVTLGLLGTIPLVAILAIQFLQFVREPSPFRDAMFMVVVVNGLTESGVISGVPLVISLVWAISIFWSESDHTQTAARRLKPNAAARGIEAGPFPVDVALGKRNI